MDGIQGAIQIIMVQQVIEKIMHEQAYKDSTFKGMTNIQEIEIVPIPFVFSVN